MTDQRKEEIDVLWTEFFESPNVDVKNQILTHYIYLVVGVVKRMMPQYREYCDKDDLISSGVLGLIDAVEKFDQSFDVKFQTYASIRIRGAVIDYLRKQDWASTGLRRKLNSIQRAGETLERELNRAPTDREIAEHLGMSEHELGSALQKSQMFNVINFEAMVYEKGFEDALVAVQHDPYQVVENMEMNGALHQVINGLPEKERMVIVLHYYEGMTMKSIAKILGVSESRVSQIHSKVLLKMRRTMESA